MKRKGLIVFTILLVLVIAFFPWALEDAASYIINESSKKIYMNSSNIQREGTWVLGDYGSYTLEPPGAGLHYLYADCEVGEEASYITPSLDMSGLSIATLSFAYSFAATGVIVVVSYSGGVNSSEYEERLLFMHEYNSPCTTTETLLLYPSTYNDSSEVYIEFYHFCSYGNNDPPGFAIDDIEISDINFFEGFESFQGSLSGYVTDPFMKPLEGALVRVSFHETYEENYTDSSGYYHVVNIPLCWCMKNATASKTGFSTESVLLSINENTTYDFVLNRLASKTLYVGGSGPGNYSTIQDAIDDAYDGDTVFVYTESSPYTENICINKTINLIGENKNTTIIDGGGNDDVIYVSAPWVNISGLTIQNSGHVYLHDAGIQVFSQFGNFSNNILLQNRYGIYLYETKGNTVSGNIISHNADGILLWESSDTIVHNTLSDNWYGIYLDDSSNNFILENNFYSNMQHAFFENGLNTWENNYWGRPRLLPKLIFGTIQIDTTWIPWINIDWHPSQQPYNIS